MLELEALVERPHVLDFPAWFKSLSDIVLMSRLQLESVNNLGLDPLFCSDHVILTATLGGGTITISSPFYGRGN